MRLLIFLALLFFAAVVAIKAGRYWAQNMDGSGRAALALLLAPAPQFLLCLLWGLTFLPSPSFGWGLHVAFSFVLSYGMMLLVYFPIHLFLALIGDRTHGRYTMVTITVTLLACVAVFFFIMPASSHPEPDVRFRSNGLYFFLVSALLIPGAAAATSIFWEIAVRPSGYSASLRSRLHELGRL